MNALWPKTPIRLFTLAVAMVFAQCARPVSAEDAESVPNVAKKQAKLYSGKVVLLNEALKERKVKSGDEFSELVALETDSGELIPIIPDWRGRAFFQDKRLRDRRVDLVGFRQKDVPLLQVLVVYTFDEKGVRQYMDYWCDVCSIPMYEIKPCECCQDEIRIRFQPQKLPGYITRQLESEGDAAGSSKDSKTKGDEAAGESTTEARTP